MMTSQCYGLMGNMMMMMTSQCTVHVPDTWSITAVTQQVPQTVQPGPLTFRRGKGIFLSIPSTQPNLLQQLLMRDTARSSICSTYTSQALTHATLHLPLYKSCQIYKHATKLWMVRPNRRHSMLLAGTLCTLVVETRQTPKPTGSSTQQASRQSCLATESCL
jgi:hypothetical protein